MTSRWRIYRITYSSFSSRIVLLQKSKKEKFDTYLCLFCSRYIRNVHIIEILLRALLNPILTDYLYIDCRLSRILQVFQLVSLIARVIHGKRTYTHIFGTHTRARAYTHIHTLANEETEIMLYIRHRIHTFLHTSEIHTYTWLHSPDKLREKRLERRRRGKRRNLYMYMYEVAMYILR